MAANNILEIIREYAGTEQTGTVMAVFEDNSMGRFYFTAGVLATARYRSKQGNEAVTLASDLLVANVRFQENADLVRSSEFIDASLFSAGGAASPRQAAPAVPSAARVTSEIESGGLSHLERSLLGEVLAEFIGPVAPVVISDLPQGISVNAAIDILSREMTTSGEAARFVKEARRALDRA